MHTIYTIAYENATDLLEPIEESVESAPVGGFMNYVFCEHVVAQERYQDFLRAAEHERLVRSAEAATRTRSQAQRFSAGQWMRRLLAQVGAGVSGSARPTAVGN